MGIRLTGFSTPVIGAEWEYTDKNTVEETTPFSRIESSHKIKIFINSKHGEDDKNTICMPRQYTGNSLKSLDLSEKGKLHSSVLDQV